MKSQRALRLACNLLGFILMVTAVVPGKDWVSTPQMLVAGAQTPTAQQQRRLKRDSGASPTRQMSLKTNKAGGGSGLSTQNTDSQTSSLKNPSLGQSSKSNSRSNKGSGSSNGLQGTPIACADALNAPAATSSSNSQTKWSDLYECVDEPPLGSGSFGVVYKIKEKTGAKSFRAMKVVRISDKTAKEEVENEFRIENELSSPLIIKVHSWKTADKMIVGVMDLATNGEFYSTFLANRRKAFQAENPKQVLFYFEQMLLAEYYLEQKKLVSRDVKMENMVLDGYRLKFIDLGLAATKGSEIKKAAGTIYYMDPASVVLDEMNGYCKKDPEAKPAKPGYTIDTYTDVYSLGMVLWNLINGVWMDDEEIYEFLGENYGPDECSHYFFAAQANYVPVHVNTPWIFRYLLSQMLQKDPAHRAPLWELIYAIHNLETIKKLNLKVKSEGNFILIQTDGGRIPIVKQTNSAQAKQEVEKWIQKNAADPQSSSFQATPAQTGTQKKGTKSCTIVNGEGFSVVSEDCIVFEPIAPSLLDTSGFSGLVLSERIRRMLLRQNESSNVESSLSTLVVGQLTPLLVLLAILISIALIFFKVRKVFSSRNHSPPQSEEAQKMPDFAIATSTPNQAVA